jgi:hypothetical protein
MPRRAGAHVETAASQRNQRSAATGWSLRALPPRTNPSSSRCTTWGEMPAAPLRSGRPLPGAHACSGRALSVSRARYPALASSGDPSVRRSSGSTRSFRPWQACEREGPGACLRAEGERGYDANGSSALTTVPEPEPTSARNTTHRTEVRRPGAQTPVTSHGNSKAPARASRGPRDPRRGPAGPRRAEPGPGA